MNDVEQRILRARLQLMLTHPFLSSAVARLPLIELPPDGPWQTAATDGFTIFWSRAFFSELSDAEIIGVLAHEVLHVVLGHLERRGNRDPERWNIAIDHATNLLLLDHAFVLPKPHLADRTYRDLSAEAIYNLDPGAVVVKPTAPRRIGRIPTPAAAPAKRSAPSSFDVHLNPEDPLLPDQARLGRPTPFELDRLKRDLVREMRDEITSSKSFGRIGGELAEAIRRSGKPRISWQQFLSRFIGGLRRDDFRMLPPSRKHLWRGIYLPSMGVPGPRLIVCAIDTSGSIDHTIAGRFLTEVHGLRVSAQCRLFVLQCDARIQKVNAYDAWDTPSAAVTAETFVGGGGTDFRPVFDWIQKTLACAEGTPDALIYLTDGYGSYPQRPPPYPVMWLIPENCTQVVPFGQRVEIFA